MTKALNLSKMSRKEKLIAMESLWADLAGDESHFESPVWHGQVLKKTERLVKDGKAKFTNWDEAKKRIRNKAAKAA